MEVAEYKLFVKIPEREPKHLTRLDWCCVECELQYHMYIVKDGDVHFGCPNCGLFQVISGPWTIWN
jgi:hypothetical protein